MWSKVLGRLEGRFPALARKLAGDRVGRELPALGVSVAFHVAVLTVLGVMGIAAQAELRRDITSQVVDTTLPPFDRQEIQDRDQSDMPAVMNPIGSSAPNVGAIALAGSAPVLAPTKADGDQGMKMALAEVKVSRPGEMVVPTAATLSQAVSIRGSGAEHVGGVEGAVDRVAMELLNRLERRQDAGGLGLRRLGEPGGRAREARQATSSRSTAHINQLDKDRIAVGDALMTMVVGFGARGGRRCSPGPTSDPAAIVERHPRGPASTPAASRARSSTVDQVIVKSWGKFKDEPGAALPDRS